MDSTRARVHIPADLVDDFAEAQALHEAFKPTEAVYERLGKEIKALIENEPPDETIVAAGRRFSLDIGPRSFESVVDVPKARRKLGAANFLAAATLTLKALGRYLTQPEIENLVEKRQIGHRKLITAKLPD